jgi:predicted PurR-regulated permease PerM
MVKENKFETYYFLLIFLVVIVLNLFLLAPLYHAIVFAGILAGTFYPLFKFLNEKKNLSKELSSSITTGVILLFIIVPLVYLMLQISKEAISLYTIIKEAISQQSMQDFIYGDGAFATMIQKTLTSLDIEVTKEQIVTRLLSRIKDISGIVLKSVNGMIGDTLTMLFQFFIMIIVTYTFFLKGDVLKKTLFKVSPLPSTDEQTVLDKFNQMNYVTMVGNGVGGLIQGAFAGIVFWIAGLSSVFLWTTVMIILAFIPLVGISLVTIPATIYLFVTGKTAMAIFLIISTNVVSLLVENWFKPKFIGQKVKIDGTLVFIYIIAGMGIFGMAGIFYGPLICIVFMTTIEIYLKNYLPKLQKNN